MASLVLGAVGSAVGSFFGPLGSAIGWSIGSMIGNLLNPQKVEGPRLNDLKLQDSQYGKMIPIIEGTVRLAGNIIWQTDLVEHSETSDGKGGPEVTTYSYTASFCVQLCEGPIVAVTRIWADGRLIHDQTNYESTTTLGDSILTIYLGTETQLPDPTMEAVEGAGNVPAYRGTALAVFTDLPMADFGNRIPNLEFEVTKVAPSDTIAHIVQSEYPLAQTWGYNGGGIGRPCIVEWIPGENIRIKNMTPGNNSHIYDATTLDHEEEVAYFGPEIPQTGYSLYPFGLGEATRVHRSIGNIISNGVEIPVYFNPQYPAVSASTTNTALEGGTITAVDPATSFDTTAEYELAASAGIPIGECVGSVLLTQDRTAMFVFTAPNAHPATLMTKWYMIVDGVVEDQGTVSGAAAIPPYVVALSVTNGSFGYGNWDSNANGLGSGTHRAGMFENNRRYAWITIDQPDQQQFIVCKITDAKVFTRDTTALTVGTGQFGFTAEFPSCFVFKEGYCGAVWGQMLAVASRFPIFEADGPSLADVVERLSERAGLLTMGSPQVPRVDVSQLEDDVVNGFILATQSSVRSAIDQLRAGYFFDAVESDDGVGEAVVKFVKRGSDAVVTIPDEDLGFAHANQSIPPLLQTTRAQEVELPRVYYVNYIDRDADYQIGTQSDRRQTTFSEVERSIQLGLVFSPQKARQVAQILLYDEWIERERFVFTTSREYAHIEPTDVVVVKSRTLRITKRSETPEGLIEWEGVAAHTRMWIAGPIAAEQEGVVTAPPAASVEQETDLLLLDIPLVNDSDVQPGINYAVNGQRSSQWRGASIFKSVDGGTNYTQITQQTVPNTIGNATTALGDFTGGNIFDELNTVEIYITASSAAPTSATETQVLNGANTAVLGAEIIQFKTATLISTRTYRLSGLLRGRYGTEWAMDEHTTLERFVLLPVHDMAVPASEINVDRDYKAVTFGSTITDAENVPFRYQGIRMKPLSPVHVGGGTDASGNVILHWIRRTRLGVVGMADVGLGESSEQYVVQIWNSTYTLVARVITGITSPTYQYTAAMQVTDFGSNQQTIYFSVLQVGNYSAGYETRATAPGTGVSNTAPLSPVDPYTGPTPPTSGTPTLNHMANFRGLYNGAPAFQPRDRQLAHKYTLVSVATSTWFFANYNDILNEFFHGDNFQMANWIQDADLSPPLDADATAPRYPNEHSYLLSLANAVN